MLKRDERVLEEERKATSIMIKPSVWKIAKHLAIDMELDLSELVERAIMEFAKKK